MSMKTSRLVISVTFLAIIGSTELLAAKLYKWVDDKGVTHYSETMPPELKDRKSTEIDKWGRVLKQNEAPPTPEQLRALEEKKERQALETKQAAEQRRRDNALMNTYTTESEINAARARAIAGATQTREAIEVRQKVLRARTEDLRRNLEALRKAGKSVPDSLRDELAANEKEEARIAGDIKTKNDEIAQIAAKYDQDKQRFRELQSAGSR
ncbi:MAG: DUF4124 domain-containing protein [Betaproteobacteria bacterium]|jgi:hypothetical protein